MSQARRIGIGAGVLGAALILVGVVFETTTTRATSRLERPRENDSLLATSTSMMTIEVGGVRWTLVSRSSGDGPCLGVVAEVDGLEQGELGGGCGRPEDAALNWGIGGIDVGGSWFNVAYGQAVPSASSVKISLGDGSVRTFDNVAEDQGLWLSVIEASPTDRDGAVVHVEVLDANRSVILSRDLPSIVDARLQALSGATPDE